MYRCSMLFNKMTEFLLMAAIATVSILIIGGVIGLYLGADEEVSKLETNYKNCNCKGKIYIERLEEAK